MNPYILVVLALVLAVAWTETISKLLPKKWFREDD